MKVKIRKIIALMMVTAMLFVSGCSDASDTTGTTSSGTTASAETTEAQTAAAVSVADRNEDGYTLDEIVILSRHNIRSPLSDEGSTLAQVTTHDWFDWTSGKSELSLRGGVLETEMGQYFRKYLVGKGLMTENWEPEDGEIRIYANSKQRTISTANCFKAGLLTVADVDTEYHCEIDTMDPVFNPVFTKLSEPFKKQVLSEIAELGGKDGLKGITEGLSDNYKLLEEILDFSDSEYAKANNITSFDTDAPEIQFELGKEPYMTGTLELTGAVADALVLQYYEENGSSDAAFGENITREQWKQIAEISDVYEETIFGSYSVAVNVANPMLKELKSELNTDGRKITYLCGHDSNILTVLKALKVEDYELPGAISKDTPIGCKLVIQKWSNEAGDSFATVDLVYQSVDQLQDITMLDLDNPPMVYSLSFDGLEKNSDGFYRYGDLMARFDEAIAAYDALPTD